MTSSEQPIQRYEVERYPKGHFRIFDALENTSSKAFPPAEESQARRRADELNSAWADARSESR